MKSSLRKKGGGMKSGSSIPPGDSRDPFCSLSLEILCHILKFLPIKDVMKMECQSKQWQEAVCMHLKLITEIDFANNEEIFTWMPHRFTDQSFDKFLRRCPQLECMKSLHVDDLKQRRCRSSQGLSVPGLTASLQRCSNLRAIEISDVHLLGSVLFYLPHVTILGCFKNRHTDSTFCKKFSLISSHQLTGLNLKDVSVNCLPSLPCVREVLLKDVHFTESNPFKSFSAPELQTFVMKNCIGPANPLKYVPLVICLAKSPNLSSLQLVRVRFLGGLFQHEVEDHWRTKGFSNLEHIEFGDCKFVAEADIGYLCIASADVLKTLILQPKVTKDSFFSSLLHSRVNFPSINIINLGQVYSVPHRTVHDDILNLEGTESSPSSISDMGMKAIGEVFTHLKTLCIYNCPYLIKMDAWFGTEEVSHFRHLTFLNLNRCHSITVDVLFSVLGSFRALKVLHLQNMFREPPKGCSRVGLSAGTGLGVSSALVANQGAPHMEAGQMMANEDDLQDPDHILNQDPDDENEVVIEDGMIYEVPEAQQPSSSSSSSEHPCTCKGSTAAPTEDPVPSKSESTEDLEAPTKGKSLRGKKKGLVKKTNLMQDQACQAHSAEIRESTKLANRPNEPCCCGSSHSKTENRPRILRSSGKEKPISAPEAKPMLSPKKRGNVRTKDQSTSTSDPVLDEDHEQLLVINSTSLECLIMQRVGITGLKLNGCSKLNILTIQQCRVLRGVCFMDCNQLHQVSISECKKIRMTSVVREISSLTSVKSRVLVLRPMSSYSESEMQYLLFKSGRMNTHAYMLHDYTSDTHLMLDSRKSALEFSKQFPGSASNISTIDNEAIKSCKLYKKEDKNMDGSDWDVVTNIPWMVDTPHPVPSNPFPQPSNDYAGDSAVSNTIVIVNMCDYLRVRPIYDRLI